MPEERKEFQEMFSELNMYEKRGVYIAMEGKPASRHRSYRRIW